jgi:hypothetical protein
MAKCSEAQAGISRSAQVLLIIWKAQSTQNSGMKKQYLFGFPISYDLPDILGFAASIIPSQWYNGNLHRLMED